MIIKLIGSAMLLGFALLATKAYKKCIARRQSECDVFLTMIDAVRDGVDYFLSPAAKIFRRFAEGNSRPAAFAKMVIDGVSPGEAFARIKNSLAVGREGREILGKFFESFGRGFKDGAVAMSEDCKKKFSEYSERCEVEDEKNTRLATALMLGGALGVIILFL